MFVCSTVKAMKAKHLAHPRQTISHHQHDAQDRRVQRTSKAEYKRLMCTEGSRLTQCFLLGVCFFPLIEEQQTATTVWHILRLLHLGDAAIQQQASRGSSLTHCCKFHIYFLSLVYFSNSNIHYFSSIHFFAI